MINEEYARKVIMNAFYDSDNPDIHKTFERAVGEPVTAGTTDWFKLSNIWNEIKYARLESIFPLQLFLKELRELVERYPNLSIS
jgi:hypothetical protein